MIINGAGRGKEPNTEKRKKLFKKETKKNKKKQNKTK